MSANGRMPVDHSPACMDPTIPAWPGSSADASLQAGGSAPDWAAHQLDTASRSAWPSNAVRVRSSTAAMHHALSGLSEVDPGSTQSMPADMCAWEVQVMSNTCDNIKDKGAKLAKSAAVALAAQTKQPSHTQHAQQGTPYNGAMAQQQAHDALQQVQRAAMMHPARVPSPFTNPPTAIVTALGMGTSSALGATGQRQCPTSRAQSHTSDAGSAWRRSLEGRGQGTVPGASSSRRGSLDVRAAAMRGTSYSGTGTELSEAGPSGWGAARASAFWSNAHHVGAGLDTMREAFESSVSMGAYVCQEGDSEEEEEEEEEEEGADTIEAVLGKQLLGLSAQAETSSGIATGSLLPTFCSTPLLGVMTPPVVGVCTSFHSFMGTSPGSGDNVASYISISPTETVLCLNRPLHAPTTAHTAPASGTRSYRSSFDTPAQPAGGSSTGLSSLAHLSASGSHRLLAEHAPGNSANSSARRSEDRPVAGGSSALLASFDAGIAPLPPLRVQQLQHLQRVASGHSQASSQGGSGLLAEHPTRTRAGDEVAHDPQLQPHALGDAGSQPSTPKHDGSTVGKGVEQSPARSDAGYDSDMYHYSRLDSMHARLPTSPCASSVHKVAMLNELFVGGASPDPSLTRGTSAGSPSLNVLGAAHATAVRATGGESPSRVPGCEQRGAVRKLDPLLSASMDSMAGGLYATMGSLAREILHSGDETPHPPNGNGSDNSSPGTPPPNATSTTTGPDTAGSQALPHHSTEVPSTPDEQQAAASMLLGAATAAVAASAGGASCAHPSSRLGPARSSGTVVTDSSNAPALTSATHVSDVHLATAYTAHHLAAHHSSSMPRVMPSRVCVGVSSAANSPAMLRTRGSVESGLMGSPAALNTPSGSGLGPTVKHLSGGNRSQGGAGRGRDVEDEAGPRVKPGARVGALMHRIRAMSRSLMSSSDSLSQYATANGGSQSLTATPLSLEGGAGTPGGGSSSLLPKLAALMRVGSQRGGASTHTTHYNTQEASLVAGEHDTVSGEFASVFNSSGFAGVSMGGGGAGAGADAACTATGSGLQLPYPTQLGVTIPMRSQAFAGLLATTAASGGSTPLSPAAPTPSGMTYVNSMTPGGAPLLSLASGDVLQEWSGATHLTQHDAAASGTPCALELLLSGSSLLLTHHSLLPSHEAVLDDMAADSALGKLERTCSSVSQRAAAEVAAMGDGSMVAGAVTCSGYSTVIGVMAGHVLSECTTSVRTNSGSQLRPPMLAGRSGRRHSALSTTTSPHAEDALQSGDLELSGGPPQRGAWMAAVHK